MTSIPSHELMNSFLGNVYFVFLVSHSSKRSYTPKDFELPQLPSGHVSHGRASSPSSTLASMSLEETRTPNLLSFNAGDFALPQLPSRSNSLVTTGDNSSTLDFKPLDFRLPPPPQLPLADESGPFQAADFVLPALPNNDAEISSSQSLPVQPLLHRKTRHVI